jgi:GNAT superfamily N-acetyltransferase
MIKLAESNNEIADCFQVMKQLRPELTEKFFVPLVRELMQEGYQVAFLQDENKVVCVAGFKISNSLSIGKNLYIDDLSTLNSSQSKGYGRQMMNWLRKLAKKEDCNYLHLDSNVTRYRAHKFYLSQDMYIASYHFAEKTN